MNGHASAGLPENQLVRRLPHDWRKVSGVHSDSDRILAPLSVGASLIADGLESGPSPSPIAS